MKIYHGRPIFTLLQTKQVKTIGLIAELRHIAPTCTLLNNYQSLISIAPYLTYGLISWANACKTFRDQILEWMNEWMNEWRVLDERTTDAPSYNTFLHVNSKFGRQHTKALLLAALSPFMSLLYPEGWPQHRGLRPLLFSNCGVDSFRSVQEPGKC